MGSAPRPVGSPIYSDKRLMNTGILDAGSRDADSGGYLVPDGLFGIEYGSGGTKAHRFFALEADRGTMPVVRSGGGQTSYLAKLASYQEVIGSRVFKTHFGIPNLLVLTLTTSTPRLYEIVRQFEERGVERAAFLFKSIDAAELKRPAPQLLSWPWLRAGLPSLGIDAKAHDKYFSDDFSLMGSMMGASRKVHNNCL